MSQNQLQKEWMITNLTVLDIGYLSPDTKIKWFFEIYPSAFRNSIES